ncbi:S-layer family protein, partial [Helicobacter pullorum]|uniref:S-layer family protein n=1 Tax=Helicobacter pullorum TaxID=35818 RepID=UPI000B0A71A8
MSNQTKNATLVGGGGAKPLNNQSLETKNPKNAKGLDSKSKLESKNPNKIQTAKIQDSKASKDLAKLESNSPKLKDSKVSKTSKDSMKLESSPKLDSKTCQKSNSKSKSPKIQKAKNTCDSKQSKKSKNSSKLKSFIRTIPISIALASALSSQAVANWNNDGGACRNGYDCTISGNLQLGNSSGNIQIIASGNTGALSVNQGVHVQKVWEGGLTGSQNGVFEIKGPTQGITNNGTVTSVGSWRNIVVLSGGSLGSIVNSSTGTLISRSNSVLLLFGRVGSIENAGTIMRTGGSNADYLSLFAIEGQVGADLTFSNQSLTRSAVGARNIIWTQGSATTSLGEIVAKDNSRLEGHFDFNNRFTGKSITFQDSANMTGNISLEGNARITNGIAIQDSANMTGAITLAGSSAIANGITIGGNSASGSGNNATLTGNISLNGSSSISKILIDGSNGSGTNGTPKLAGNITMDGTSAIANGITITNGGTYAGRIHTKSQSDIDSITIASGGVVGSSNTNSTILSSGNSTIHNIEIQNGGTMYGNIEAHWIGGANAVNQKDGNIGNVSIAGRLEGGVKVYHNAVMDSLTMSGSGTIVDGIEVGVGSSPDQTSSINTITLEGNSGINAITLGGVANADANIGSLTLGGTSSIGTITNNSNGTITNIALNGTSTITNGITNASGGTISNITLASSNTIHNGITNNANGNIGTITSNTNNGVNNTITNSGTIAKLDIQNGSTSGGNGGTINYIGSGIVTEEIRVEGGATLSIDGGAGTITLDSNTGSKLNLLADSIFQGSLKNAGSISTWNNVSNIDGSFINASGASVGTLTAGNIRDNFLNEGSITNLTINKNIGTLTNNGSGVINTLTIQNNSIITNGITNDSNIGSLNLQNNTTYIGTGSITNALDIANNKTLTATNNGINILFANNATGTIANEGIIDGSLTNKANSTIKTFNTGSISGNLTNDARATIETLNVDSNVGSIANSGNINTLNVTGNVTNGITNKASSTITTLTINNGASLGSGITNAGNITTLTNNQANTNITNNQNIGTLDIKANTTYAGAGSITNALDINGAQTQFTISDGAGNNGTLTLTNTAGANSVKTITNEGTIIGNLTNTLTTDWTFGVLQGNFTNNGNLTAFNTGSITEILTNGNNGIINTLNTSKVGGSIANNGNLVNVIVDADKTLTGNGSITNSLVVQKNNGGNGYTLTIGSGGTGNLDFKATNGIINNAGTINGNITNVSGSTIADFTNSGNMVGNITNSAGSTITIFENIGTITGNIDNTGVITDFDNQGIINGTLTNNGNIGDFTNSGSIKEFNNQKFIAFYENSGTIGKFNNTGTIYGVSNSKVITGDLGNNIAALKNTGTITGNVNLTGTCPSGGCPDDYDETLASFINNEGTIGGSIANNSGHTLTSILNDSNGTIQNGITNNGSITNITNEGKINANGITNSSQIGMINNTGLITGNLTNNTSSIITTINTGSITGSITNSGEITTLNVTGNVTNGITNNSNITNLTINKGVNLGNSGITNNANIGSLLVNESVSYSGTGSISNALEVAKDKTLAATNGITLNAKKGSVNNLGTIAGNLTLKGSSNTLSNAGTINGNLTNSANTSTIANSGSINGTIINNVANGTIINADNSNIAALDINESVIYNQGTNANITSNIDIAQGKTLTATNGITLNATNGSVNNLGILAGILTLEGSSNSVTNSGSITTIINNANNSSLTNNSNIGSLAVYENLTYNGNGSDRITQALIVAEDKTLTIGSNGTLSFNSTKGSVNNLGTIAGNLANVKDSTITSFINSGTITGNLYNDGHIDTLHNTGTMGTIYNRSKNTIKNLLNDKNSVIAGIDNSNGRYDSIKNQGTILGNIDNNNGTITNLFNANNGTITGNINNNNGTITNLVNANSGTITGQIISNGTSNIGTIINEGVINSSHTMNDSDIQNASNDAISLDTISNVVTAISNSGSINGNVRVAGNSEVNLIQNSKVIAGCIILEGGRIGKINNTNGAIANCMSFSSGASVDNLNNGGTIKDKITNNSGSITIDNSGSIGGITTSNGGNTTIINGGIEGNTIKPGGNIGLITNDGSNSNTHIDGWTLDNPENPDNAIKVTGNLDGIHLKEDSIFVEGNLESGKIYDYYDYIKDENGNSIGQDFSQDDELFDALTFIPIFNPTDNGDGTFSVGLDTRELSGKTLGASLIYSSRMRQIDTNNMLREINVKNFKTDFEILEQRERLKNQQALLENYKQQRASYLNGLTKDNKELKRVSSKESTSLSTYANNSNIKSDAIEVVDYYNEDVLASLDNLQATTKANQETYSNLDLLRELDDIFISHTGNNDNLYTFALPYTRYTSAQLDGGVGTLKSHASGILAGAQAKLPSERGILGIYFGYESSDKQVGQQR